MRRQRGAIFLSIGVFGLVFALFALFVSWRMFGDELGNAWRVRGWVEAPATLVEVSGHPKGMGAAYRYRYAGTDYEGTRVGFYDNWSGGDFSALHVAYYRRLRAKLEASGPVRTLQASGPDGHRLRAIGAGAPITVWLDPAKPAEAVIDPSILWKRMRTPMTIAGALVAAGLLIAVIGFQGLRGASSGTGATALGTKQPIPGSSRRFPAAGWLAGLAWNAIVAVNVVDFRPVPGRETLAWLALGAFVLVGLGILWYALFATLRWRRYRGIALDLDPYPGEAGGLIAGSVVVPIQYETAHRFRFRLACAEHGMRNGELHKNNSFERTLYEESAIAQAVPAPEGTELRFRFAVPAQAPASEGYLEALTWTRETAHRVFVRWTLRVEAEVPGVDLQEGFEIPVRRVAGQDTPRASQGMIGAAVAPAAVAREHAEAPDDAAASDIPAYVYERAGDRIRVTQPAWKKPIPGLYSASSLIFGVGPSIGFVAIGWWLTSEGQWMGAIFLLIGVAAIAALVGYLAHARTVEVDEKSIRIERRIFGLRVKQVNLSRDYIAAIEATAESAASRGRSMILRDVKARMRNGSTHTIAGMIPRARDAQALRNLIAARLAVGTAGSVAVAQATTHVPREGHATPGWVRLAGVAFVLALIGFQAWPFLSEYIGLRKPAPAETPRAATPAPAPARSSPEPARGEPLPAMDDWKAYFQSGLQAKLEQRPDDALQGYRAALEIIQRTRGADDPLAAAMHERIADIHTGRRNHAEAERALRSALAILEKHTHAAVRAEAGKLVMFDRESVMRGLGWALWELRRYPESLAHYQRAYDMVAELDIDDANRNRRLAYNSAGIMVGACTQSDWPRAERAMAELKERMARVSESDRRWLDYWVRTGEPRLAARKC